jgi:hypothetical protein
VSADQTTELREVSLNAFKQDDMASVYCRHPRLTRRLLRHELAEIDSVELLSDHAYHSLTLEEAVARDNPQVVGINAEVPVGALKIGSTARNNDRLTNLVSP